MPKETPTEKTLTVDELAVMARQGDKAAQWQLWESVKRWAYLVAMKYRTLAELNGGAGVEDLEQCAALGVLNAVRLYNGERGAFTSWCEYYIRRECRKVLGLCGRERKEHYFAARLNEPLPGAEDLTLLDCIEDEASTAAMEGAEDRACNDVLRADLLQAMDKLSEQSRHMIHRYDLDGLTLQEAAREMGVGIERGRQCRINGLRAMKRDPYLRLLYAPTQWRRKGLKAFNTTFSSIVEDEVIWKIDERSV